MAATHRTLLVLISVLVVAGMGCDELQQDRERGRYGELYFTIDTGGVLRDIRDPVAIGALLDVEVEDENGNAVTVQEASFRSDRTFEVVSTAGNVVTVRATGEYDDELEVVATRGGEELEDVVRLRAEEVEGVIFTQPCKFPEREPAHFITGNPITLGFSLRDRANDELMGYGYAPVRVVPEDALVFDENRVESNIRFDAPSETGLVRVQSTLDDAEVAFQLVTVEDVNDLEVTGLKRLDLQGLTPTRKIWPLVGENRVCQAAGLVEVASFNNSNCTVEMVSEPGDDHAKMRFDALTPGTCEVTLRIPATGFEKTFEFNVTN